MVPSAFHAPSTLAAGESVGQQVVASWCPSDESCVLETVEAAGHTGWASWALGCDAVEEDVEV